ncbi:MAG: hypothetical protein O9346_04655 [Leptospiraceae bacterium]|nr:hypothetical protein [Leptospiraceae bacterium]MCZ8345687.1 hypothetical protein [Leptospiraceae bacterium]
MTRVFTPRFSILLACSILTIVLPDPETPMTRDLLVIFDFCIISNCSLVRDISLAFCLNFFLVISNTKFKFKRMISCKLARVFEPSALSDLDSIRLSKVSKERLEFFKADFPNINSDSWAGLGKSCASFFRKKIAE